MVASIGRAFALAALLGQAARADEGQLFVFVSVDADVVVERLTVALDRPEGARSVVLSDDGTAPHDVPGDRTFTGALPGSYARTTLLELEIAVNGAPHVLFAGPVRTDDRRRAAVGFAVRSGPEGPLASRVPVSWPGTGTAGTPALPLIAAFGWGLLGLGYCALLLRGRRRPIRARSAP